MRRREGGKEEHILLRECSRGTEHTYLQWVGTDGQTDKQIDQGPLCSRSVHLRPAHRHDTIRVEEKRGKARRRKEKRREEKKKSRHTFLQSDCAPKGCGGVSQRIELN